MINILLLFTAFLTLMLGLVAFLSGPTKKVNKLATLFIASSFIWTITNYLTNISSNIDSTIIFAKITIIGAALIPLTFLMFVYEHTGTRLAQKVRALFVIPLAILLLSATNLNIVSIGAYGKDIVVGPLYILIMVEFIIFFWIGFHILLKKRDDILTKTTQKKQINYILVGCMFALAPALVTNAILPALGYGDAASLGPCFTLFMVVGVSVAIIRYGLLDFRFIIVRSIAYLMSILTLILVFAGITIPLTRVFIPVSFSQDQKLALYAVVAVLLAVILQPIKMFFNKVTDEVFYKDAYDPQTFISQLNQHLVSDIHLNSLLLKCSDVIIANLKVEFCAFGLKQTENLPQQIIGNNKKHFKQSDIDKVRALTPTIHKKIIITDDLDSENDELKDLLISYNIGALARLTTNITDEKEGIGYIVLGYKKSGSLFNSADSAVLEIVANELVIAIQNAMQFEEIQQFNITLQKKVEEATHELQRSNKKLVALDEAKDEFISMASHQLRTPLTSVKGYISMLMDGDFGKIDKKQKDVLKDAFVSSQRMVFLIADFLNVSRLKTGKFIIEPEEVYLPDVVQEEINQLKEMAVSRNLSLEYEAPSDFPKVMLDENKIRQVMMNFVDNAIYYTPAGGKVKVELYATSTDVIYKVVDNGIGVPKAEQHRLFTKFFRAKNAQKARPDGTGLGIFMAQKVIVGQAGNVIFESTENKGSTFGFSFPLSKIKVTDKR